MKIDKYKMKDINLSKKISYWEYPFSLCQKHGIEISYVNRQMIYNIFKFIDHVLQQVSNERNRMISINYVLRKLLVNGGVANSTMLPYQKYHRLPSLPRTQTFFNSGSSRVPAPRTLGRIAGRAKRTSAGKAIGSRGDTRKVESYFRMLVPIAWTADLLMVLFSEETKLFKVPPDIHNCDFRARREITYKWSRMRQLGQALI